MKTALIMEYCKVHRLLKEVESNSEKKKIKNKALCVTCNIRICEPLSYVFLIFHQFSNGSTSFLHLVMKRTINKNMSLKYFVDDPSSDE